MKIQCNVCEAAEATVLCCADEAALCYACDEKVHAANKLASKHQRVSLSNSSSPMPKCDICQETVGYFFCLEDRALLCRKCDFSIHSVNTHVSAHKRFLLTGVTVGLDPIDRSAPTLCGKPKSPEKVTEAESSPLCRKNESNSLGVQNNNGSSFQVPGASDSVPTKFPLCEGGGSEPGSFQPWQLDEIFGLGDLNQNYNYIENGLSKADSSKLEDSEGSSLLMAADFEVDFEVGGDESMGQVPEIAWAVPELLSPPTASGLHWPNSYEHHMDGAPAFVPDVCYSPMHPYHRQWTGSNLKRKRQ